MELNLSSLELPLRLRTDVPMSDQEFLRFSEANSPFRMEREPNGEILLMTPAGSKTGLINGRVFGALLIWANEDGRGQAFDSSTGFKLANGAVRSPDASWVSNRRWNALTDAEQDGFAVVP